MDTHDLARLNVRLQKLYGDRFPGLTLGMAELWMDDLRTVPADVVAFAVKRWAREHTHKAPALEDLCTLAEIIQREQRRATTAQTSFAVSLGDTEFVARREALITPAEIRALIESALPGYGWEPPQEDIPDAAD